MLIEILTVAGVSGLALLGYRKLADGQHGQVTAARQIIFENAMSTPGMSPEKLRALADAYASQGLRSHAEQLRQRAANAELPAEVKEKHKEIFRKAIASVDAAAIEAVAAAFAKMGKTASAEQLRTYAKGLRAKATVTVTEGAPVAASPSTPTTADGATVAPPVAAAGAPPQVGGEGDDVGVVQNHVNGVATSFPANGIDTPPSGVLT